MTTYKIHHGSNLDILPTLPDNSIDSIITDPPYELGFMGKSWDSTGIAYNVELWKQCLRVLKPGGHLVAFSGSRTYHRMAVAIEDAGFQIRDQMMWVYGSGFPKSHNIGKKIEGWDGWGTALKPAHEPIVLARKPLEGTVAANVLKWGVGGLNIDACRVGTDAGWSYPKGRGGSGWNGQESLSTNLTKPTKATAGRWPANLMHDGGDEVAALFPNDAGRFFYCPKASKKDRDEGCEGIKAKVFSMSGNDSEKDGDIGLNKSIARHNFHPTVKPTDLMRYLCRLVTPPGATVLDPFNGSGSTGKAAILEGFNYVGIELDAEYIKISEARIKAVIP